MGRFSVIDNGLTVLLIIGLLWFWWDSRGVAERAIQAAKRQCDKVEVTFLNDTVAWKKIRLKRNNSGRMQMQRTYAFEFASDMAQRYNGEVVMLGHHLTEVSMEAHRIS